MSRVYNVLTGAGRPAGPAAEAPDDEESWEEADEAPFVEVGGPGGPVFSPAAPRPTPAPAPPAPEFPRLAPQPAAPAYLSVRFHDLATRAGRPAGDAPDPGLVALHAPDHPASAEYRTLRDEIRKQLPEATSHVLTFAAAAPESGTTTVLLNLAVTLARDGKSRVLVADANTTRPGAAQKFALRPAPGLAEVLAGRVPLAWAVQPAGLPNLHVLPAGEATDGTAGAVGRDLPRLLAQLRQWYDWVLVDAGVWGDAAERDAACPSADAVYLVTRADAAERPEFVAVRGWVRELGGLLRGYVATRA
ncbi:MAG: hypothetical protein C0501_16075 [Isosphaera sp.]|nr:hypothetical protein [Isosphaera sp.]